MAELKNTTGGSGAQSGAPDPLASPALKGPGIITSVLEAFFGAPRRFEVLQIEVTSHCPASCSYCPHSTMKDGWLSRHMSAATFAALWPLLRQAKRVHLQGWGEPLLHPRFFDFVEVARRAGCRVSTTSCGLMMNGDIARRLVRSGIDVIAFSLAGTDEASNASRRGAPFSKVCESIKILQQVRKKLVGVHLEVHIAYLLLASGLDALDRLPELLEELEAHSAVVSTMDFIAAPELAPEAFMPHESEKIAAARAVLERVSARSAEQGRNIYYSLPVPQARADCLENVGSSMYIDADGRISPCIYVNLPLADSVDYPLRRVFGRAGDDDPLEVWERPEFNRFREAVKSGAADVASAAESANCQLDANCLDCPKRFAIG
ncbi:radical SAM protein, partial [Desulfovibrio sp. OttesenSCG-928-C06]|nr:radical SAM protein [Desulfovibrio sp. OttesenSCG-928-C06]